MLTWCFPKTKSILSLERDCSRKISNHRNCKSWELLRAKSLLVLSSWRNRRSKLRSRLRIFWKTACSSTMSISKMKVRATKDKDLKDTIRTLNSWDISWMLTTNTLLTRFRSRWMKYKRVLNCRPKIFKKMSKKPFRRLWPPPSLKRRLMKS